jgi:aldehyde oxidoreductase
VHRNACRCTGYKQLVDAVMDAAKVLRGEMKAEELMYKVPADGQIWGGKYPRPSAVAKVTGTLDYGADLGLKMPTDTLKLALVQATISHANIKSIDTSEAEKMPGVFKVVTHKDIRGKNRITGLITFPTTSATAGTARSSAHRRSISTVTPSPSSARTPRPRPGRRRPGSRSSWRSCRPI